MPSPQALGGPRPRKIEFTLDSTDAIATYCSLVTVAHGGEQEIEDMRKKDSLDTASRSGQRQFNWMTGSTSGRKKFYTLLDM